jgi:hypothetical protein
MAQQGVDGTDTPRRAAGDDAGLQFISTLIGLQTPTLRGFFVLLLAIFVLLVSLVWHHVLDVSHGWDLSAGRRNSPTEHSALATESSRRPHEPAAAVRPSSSASARKELRRPRQPVPHGAHLAACRVSVPAPDRAATQGSSFARPGPSRIARCAIPVLAFVLVCALPVGNPHTCHVSTEQAVLGVAIERASPALTTTMSTVVKEKPKLLSSSTPRALSPVGHKQNSRTGAEVSPRSPP